MELWLPAVIVIVDDHGFAVAAGHHVVHGARKLNAASPRHPPTEGKYRADRQSAKFGSWQQHVAITATFVAGASRSNNHVGFTIHDLTPLLAAAPSSLSRFTA